jgi:hypothetical protein
MPHRKCDIGNCNAPGYAICNDYPLKKLWSGRAVVGCGRAMCVQHSIQENSVRKEEDMTPLRSHFHCAGEPGGTVC